MQSDPRHRYLAVAAAVNIAAAPPQAHLEAALYTLISQGTCSDEDVAYAYDLYIQENHRGVMDAFALAKVQPEQVAKTLEMPAGVIGVYRYLFMDTGAFRNRLEVLAYAAGYQGTEYTRELVRAAVEIGLEYLLWAFGGHSGDMDNRTVVRRTMVDAFMRGMAHKGNSITSATTKAAKEWWTTAIQNAQIIEKIDPRTGTDAYRELKIAIEKRDTTSTSAQSPVPVDEILR